MSNYLKAAGFYSYDAASVDEDPTAHWIGREVKRFLDEADKHVPLLLQVASAPADVCEDMALNENDKQGGARDGSTTTSTRRRRRSSRRRRRRSRS